MVDNSDNTYQPDEDNVQMSQGSFAPDATPVCPKCLRPCHPLQYYCQNCDSGEPINPLAAYMPYVRLRYMYSIFGTMWRKVEDNKADLSSVILLTPLMVFLAPIILYIGPPVIIYRLCREPRLRTHAAIGLLVIIVALLILFIFLMLS